MLWASCFLGRNGIPPPDINELKMRCNAFLLAVPLCLMAQTPPADPCDPARPKLKRGKPTSTDPRCAPEKENPPERVITGGPARPDAESPEPSGPTGPLRESPSSEGAGPTAPIASNDPIDLARQAAWEFSQKLPNFICNQLTSRHSSMTRPINWKYEDRVEAELLYLDGREDYRNIRRNGKPIRKGSPEDTGQWSSGEFGTVLLDILSSSTNATFTRRKGAVFGTTMVDVYDYTVLQPNSHWQIRYGPTIKPAYKGSLWIDPKTSRVMRIEMSAVKLPDTYEMDVIEVTVDYGWVKIGADRYLLPTKSENLACRRGSMYCSRNEIEFRDYRKFTAESTIGTTESTVSFEEAKPPSKPPASDPAKKKQ